MSGIPELVKKYPFLPDRAGAIAVPDGWHGLLVDFVRRCSRLFPQPAWGMAFRIQSIRENGGRLEVRLADSTLAPGTPLAGIVRKFERRSMCTCYSCGEPALPPDDWPESRPVCPSCGAKPALAKALQELTLWQGSDDTVRASAASGFPIPWLLRSDYREWLTAGSDPGRLRPPWDNADWMMGLVKASRSRVLARD